MRPPSISPDKKSPEKNSFDAAKEEMNKTASNDSEEKKKKKNMEVKKKKNKKEKKRIETTSDSESSSSSSSSSSDSSSSSSSDSEVEKKKKEKKEKKEKKKTKHDVVEKIQKKKSYGQTKSTAWSNYVKVNYEKERKKNPNVPFETIPKNLSVSYKLLSPEEKKAYQDLIITEEK